MYNFQCLTTNAWATDRGFRRVLTANPGVITYPNVKGMEHYRQPGRPDIGQYLQKEKADSPLWQLLLNMGRHTVPQTLEYFNLPADTRPFLQWVSDWVSHEDRDQVAGLEGFFGGLRQMSHLPYAELYRIWSRADEAQRVGHKGNILVYLDRITDQQGLELARYDAPATNAH